MHQGYNAEAIWKAGQQCTLGNATKEQTNSPQEPNYLKKKTPPCQNLLPSAFVTTFYHQAG